MPAPAVNINKWLTGVTDISGSVNFLSAMIINNGANNGNG